MDLSKYRPILLLTLISKIFEKIAYKQIIDYIGNIKYYTNIIPVLEQNF